MLNILLLASTIIQRPRGTLKHPQHVIPFFYIHVTQQQQKVKRKSIMTVHIIKKVICAYNRARNIKGNDTA